MRKIGDLLFGKNYPLWVILVLLVVIGYLAFTPLNTTMQALREKRIMIINGKAVTCLPFEVKPMVEK